MVKSVKARKRRRGTFNYAKAKLLKKNTKQSNFLRNNPEWQKSKTVAENFQDFGLEFNLNKALISQKQTVYGIKSHYKCPIAESQVIKRLKTKSFCESNPRNRMLPPGIAKLVTYLLNKYGEDYRAMSCDPRNYDQLTPKQLARHVRKFKTCTLLMEELMSQECNEVKA